MKILRVKDEYLTLWDLSDWLNDKGVSTGDKFGISWKVGKRRKLRSYHLISLGIWECDCCGEITSIKLSRGGRAIKLDNHFGPSSFTINT